MAQCLHSCAVGTGVVVLCEWCVSVEYVLVFGLYAYFAFGCVCCTSLVFSSWFLRVKRVRVIFLFCVLLVSSYCGRVFLFNVQQCYSCFI